MARNANAERQARFRANSVRIPTRLASDLHVALERLAWFGREHGNSDVTDCATMLAAQLAERVRNRDNDGE
jgi:hypothetical protein